MRATRGFGGLFAAMALAVSAAVDVAVADYAPLPPRKRLPTREIDPDTKATEADLLGKSHGKGQSKRAKRRVRS